MLQLFVQTYHRLLSAFGTSITNAYSTHFVKSSGLNAKAKFYHAFAKALFNSFMQLLVHNAIRKLQVWNQLLVFA